MITAPQVPIQCQCGSRSFVVLTPVRGVWRDYVTFNPDGTRSTETESSTDDLKHGRPPKKMRCENCNRFHPYPGEPNLIIAYPKS